MLLMIYESYGKRVRVQCVYGPYISYCDPDGVRKHIYLKMFVEGKREVVGIDWCSSLAASSRKKQPTKKNVLFLDKARPSYIGRIASGCTAVGGKRPVL